MSKKVDERVVEMQFDNKQFERNVSTTMSTLDKLKQKLKLDGAAKGFDNVQSSANKVNFSVLSNAVESVGVKFNAMYSIADQVFRNLTNSAMQAGKQIISAFTIDPIKTGFQEYETQINAVQTILANTQSKGSTLSDVNAALDELNKYADQTIYNFTEMTRNIGTFTAAGVDLDKSVTSIKGIANLAAVSGSTSQQASTAMYQLSQALAAGKVQLMDWNSVVNAGMGGQVFQDALKRTATQMGTNVDALIEKYGSFRESLTEGNWLTAEVLTETLTQLSGAYTEADLIAQGYSEEQAKEITELAETAVNAATKVKTFTQLWDTLKEAAQSGWTQTWETLVGDFEEAKDLLTELSETFGGIIQQSADARNNLLYDAMTSNWKKITDGITEAGLSAEDFKDKVTEVAKAQNIDIDAIVKDYGSLEAAFKNGALSSDLLDQALLKMTGTTEEIAKKTEELRGEYKTNADVLKALNEAGYEQSDIQELIAKDTQGQTIALNDLTDAQLLSIGYTSEQIQSIRNLATASELANGSLSEFIDNVAVQNGREMLIDALRVSLRSLISVCEAVGKAWREVFPPTTSEQLLGVVEGIRNFAMSLRPTEETLDKIQRTFRGFFSVLSLAKQALVAILSPVGNLAKDIFGLSGGILDATAAFGDWLFALDQSAKAGELFSSGGEGISKILGQISDGVHYVIDGIGNMSGVFSTVGNVVSKVFNFILDTISGTVGWIKDNLTSFDIFAGLAGGGIFVVAKKLSGIIDSVKDSFSGFFDISKGGFGFKEILDSVHESLQAFQQGIKVAALVGIATAVMLLSSALRKISEIEPAKLAYSLGAMQLMIMALNSGFKSLVKTLGGFKSGGAIRASVAMIAMAEAVNLLGDAMTKMSELNLSELAKGLVGISVSMTVLSSAIKRMSGSNITLRTSVAMLALAKACEMLSVALGGFAQLSWKEIARGLTAMGGALAEFTVALSVLGKFGGMGSVLGATGMLIAAQSLYAISDNLKKLGAMSWDTINKGLYSMGVALGTFMGVLSVLSKIGGFGALLGGTAILIAVQSLDEISENLERMGKMPWDQIQNGLSAMATALFEFTVALGVLSKVGGFGSILGGTALLIAVQSLDEISENLERLGSMSWDAIEKGLYSMGIALGTFMGVLGALSKIGGFGAILGGTAILVAVQSLDEISENLERLGGLSWGEIGRGLTAMGLALAEIAAVSGTLGKLAGFSSLFGAGAIFIVTQGLEEIASSMKTLGSMSWSEIGRGLTAMGGALAEIAVIEGVLGSLTNVFGVLGGASLALGMKGLDEVATALQKFGSMSWDEIGRGLSAMGGALGELALGGFLNTFALIGNIAISEISVSLGDLADSVMKWKDVVVPDGLAAQLSSLAGGVNAFMFAGWGADAISTVAEPLGVMADSVKKWVGVIIPSELGTNIGSLANGVNAFMFAGWGADALATAAPGIGDMADAVKKWSDVTIPESLSTGLTGLADGVKAFSFAFTGGWSIGIINEPLSQLADTVKKWNDVSIPEGIQNGLEGLAAGVGAFGFGSGWSLGGVVEPLSQLADSAAKWNNVSIANVGTDLTNLANGLSYLANTNISSIVSSFENAANTVGQAATNLINSFVNGLNAGRPIITSALSGIMTSALSSVTIQAQLFNTAGVAMMAQLSNGITVGGMTTRMTFGLLITTLLNDIMVKQILFNQAGLSIMTFFTNGAQTGESGLRTMFTSVLSNALVSIKSQYQSFYSAGGYLVQGFAAGISAYSYIVEEKAASMARKAYEAAMKELDAHSPSKLFEKVGSYVPLGFVRGIDQNTDLVSESAVSMADAAIQNAKNTISRIVDAIDGNIDTQPTIRPVLDLTDVETKAGQLNTLFSTNQAMSIGSRMNAARSIGSEIQNGTSDTTPSQVFKFEQNNYSPKSLSRVDIYRQTKNLFSAMERRVKV